jgi:hypothetical protein
MITENDASVDAMFAEMARCKHEGVIVVKKEKEEEEEEKEEEEKNEEKSVIKKEEGEEEDEKKKNELSPYKQMWKSYGHMIRAYQSWLSDLYPMQPPIVSHTCTHACEYATYGDVYFCSVSGNIHVCNIRECKSQIRLLEGMMCSLTSNLYPLPLDNVLHGRSLHLNSYKPVKRESLTKRKKVTIQKPAEIKAPVRVTVSLPSVSPSTLKTVIRKRKAKQEDIQKQRGNASTIVHKLFSIVGKPSPPTDVVRRVSNTCCRLWSMISVCGSFKRQCTSYKFDNHCFIVIWNTVNGLYLDGLNVIDQEPWMRENLPVRQVLTSWLAIPQRKLTDTEKFFKQCINDLKENNKLAMMISSSVSSILPPEPVAIKRRRAFAPRLLT